MISFLGLITHFGCSPAKRCPNAAAAPISAEVAVWQVEILESLSTGKPIELGCDDDGMTSH